MSLRRANCIAATIQSLLCALMVAWVIRVSQKESTTSVMPLELGIYRSRGNGEQICQVSTTCLVLLLALFTCVTAAFHIRNSRKGRQESYQRDVDSGRTWWRWVEYSITATIMVVVICLTSGLFDVYALACIVTMICSCMLLGWVAEDDDTRKGTATVAIAWALLVVPFIIVWHAYVKTTRETSVPSFVTAIISAMTLMYISFGFLYIVQKRGKRVPRTSIERSYIINSMCSKTLLVLLLFSGLAAAGEAV